MLENLNRKQLGERVNNYPYSVYHRSMKLLFKEDVDVGKIGFNSAVYYVRAALEKKFDIVYPLPYVEKLMVEMGWVDGQRRPTKK